ncbi:MAG: T9SS type A sorting domain-containing protein [Bacteroidetes bacterium]|nr:T9SS type A sorting domain-containing protein [Bacteroidota bacterium]
MRRMLLALFSALCISSSAQITITASTFPVAGDTFRIAIDMNPTNIQAITPPGGNQLWDFSSLQIDQTNEVIYQPASAGVHSMSFPGAELVTITPNAESYLNVTSTQFQSLGYAGVAANSFGIQVLAKYSPPITERKVPLNFFDLNPQEFNLTLPFSSDVLPDTLLSFLPIVPDSFRIRLTTNRTELTDGWGNCQIPGGNYEVLRIKRTDYISSGMDVKVPFLGWLDLSGLIGGGGGGTPIGNFIGTDTIVSYHFLSGTEHQEIAAVTLSNDQSSVQSVQFKNNAIVANNEVDAPGAANIQAFPNPAVERVRFDCTNLPSEEYTLKIFNIIGKVVWKQNYAISGNRSMTLELEDFRKGTYLYSLVDSKGNIIGTKRLVVLKP